MKNLLLLIVILVAFFSCENNKDKQITLSGEIINPSKTYVFIRTLEQKNLDSIKLDSTNKFRKSFNLEEGFYQFFYGTEQTKIYLKPGFNLTLSLNTKEFDESIQYNGKGAEINNYLAKKFLKFEDEQSQINYSNFFLLDENDYINAIDSIYKSKMELLNQTNDLPEFFIKNETKTIEYNKLSYLMMYENLHGYLTKNHEFEVSDNFPNVFANLDLSNPLNLKIPEYIAIATGYIEKIAFKHIKRYNDNTQIALLSVIDSIQAHEDIKSQLAYNTKYYFLLTETPDSAFKLYQKLLTNDLHFKEIETDYQKLKKLKPGQPSPTFALPNENGDTVTLADFKGNIIYIDIWASWCGPCIEEIPHLKKLIEEFKDKNIAFISICAWDTKENWLKALKHYNLNGIQLFAEKKNNPFLRDYILSGVPRFVLIDKEGKIIEAKAPRPSSTKIKELFFFHI